MIPLDELWQRLKFISEPPDLKSPELKILQSILEEERRAREGKRIQHLLKQSGIKRIKLLEDFDWAFNPKLPREAIMEFLNTPWVEKARHLVLMGPSGVGKSHLASSLCYRAIQQGYRTVFISCFDLIQKLKRAKIKNTFIQHYATVDVFCLDELGYVFLSQEEANDIFQVISKRSELGATLVTSNLIPSQWGKIFDAATATAILDRLSLNGTFLTLEGKSYRSKR